MKSEEEFIAGIYKKAEERKTAEENAAREKENAGKQHHFHLWQGVAAAAGVCLIVSGAAYAGAGRRPDGVPNGSYSEQEDNGAEPDAGIMPLSEDGVEAYRAQEEPQSRIRSIEPAGYEVTGAAAAGLTAGAYAGMAAASGGN